MKKIYLSLTLIFLAKTAIASALLESKKQYNAKKYFKALDIIAKEYKYKEPDALTKQYIERLVKKTGTHYFNTYDDTELRKINVPSSQLIMAKRNLYLNKYSYALKRLDLIPNSNRFYPESLLVKGTVYFNLKKYKSAAKEFNNCFEKAQEREKFFKSKIKRYYAVIKESCAINIARIYFNSKKYEQAIKFYEKIPKNSFMWPYTLIQKAWAYHHIKEYNRSLGILMTYDSPLLESYFEPEAQTLKALNYYELCQYEDALRVIDTFYKVFKPRADKLKSIINKGKNTPLYFHKLMKTPTDKLTNVNRFIRNLKTQASKRVKYNLDMYTVANLKKEYEITKDNKDRQTLREINHDLLEQINHYLKVSFYRFLNDIYEQSQNLFSIKLEVLSNAREQVYDQVKRVTLKRGDAKNIKRKANQEYWGFKEEFWADELGEYSFSLESKCKLKKEVKYDI